MVDEDQGDEFDADDELAEDGLDRTITRHGPRSAAKTLCLIVLGDGLFATHPLPMIGQITIGRAPTCAVQIDHPEVSREHVTLQLAWPRMRLEDLGSANGTRVRGQPIDANATVDIVPGDVIEIGSTILIVQSFAGAHRSSDVWTHDYFESRIEDACALSSRTGVPFCVVRVQLRGNADRALVATLISDTLRPGDNFAEYGPRDFELLLPVTTAKEADKLLVELGSKIAAVGTAIAVGVAVYGRDGRTHQALIERASERLLEVTDQGDLGGVEETCVMERLDRMVRRIAQGEINVLILGETGSGKEVMAQRLHLLSPRAARPFVAINCAALSESLLESELFGHERGAFTGAVQTKQGLLESADGGTLLLDEIGDLPLPLQAKLLRVIEERSVRPVGGLSSITIDVRFLAATHRDLEQEIERGAFRKDLYFRLSGITVVVPPLRERTDEIETLARAFITRVCASSGRPEPLLASEALDVLLKYSWPGNVRELRNVIERAVLLCENNVISVEHFPRGWTSEPKVVSLDDYQRKLLVEALEQCNGNQTLAAKKLGISRRTILNRIEAYGLPRPRKDQARRKTDPVS